MPLFMFVNTTVIIIILIVVCTVQISPAEGGKEEEEEEEEVSAEGGKRKSCRANISLTFSPHISFHLPAVCIEKDDATSAGLWRN